MVLARHLGAASFGETSVAFLVCRYGGLIADWGATFRGARDVAGSASAAEVTALLRLRALVGTGLAVLYVIGVGATDNGTLAPMAVVIIAGGWSRDWLALGNEQGVRSSIPSVVRGVLVLAGAFAARDPGDAAVAVAVGYGASTVVSVILNPHSHAVREKGGMLVDAWMLIAVLMAQIYTSLDTVLLAGLRSSREAGIYAAVYRVPLAWTTVVGLLVSAYVPVATSTLRDDPAQLPPLRRQAFRAGAIGAAAVMASIPVLVPLFSVLFGDAFVDGRVPLALLLVATAVSTLSAPLGALYLGVGKDRDFALVLTAGAVVNVVANVAVIPHFGMNGAAVTTIASETLVLVAMARLLARR